MFRMLTGWQKYAAVGVAVLVLIAVIVLGVRGCAKDERNENDQLVRTGQILEREAGQRKVIKDVEEARDAVDNPTGNDLSIVCQKYDRNCKNSK